MAERKSGPKHFVAHPKYAGQTYDCYGKKVRTGKGKKRAKRVFCGKQKK